MLMLARSIGIDWQKESRRPGRDSNPGHRLSTDLPDGNAVLDRPVYWAELYYQGFLGFFFKVSY